MGLAEQSAARESSAGRRPPKPRRTFENSRKRVSYVVRERLSGPRQGAAFTAREASERRCAGLGDVTVLGWSEGAEFAVFCDIQLTSQK